MDKYFYYLKGTIISPQKTFQEIIDDKESKRFILITVFTLFIVGLLNTFLVPVTPQKLTHITTTSLLVKRFFDNFRYLTLFAPVTWFVFNFVLHQITRAFSDAGKFTQLLTVSGFISVIFSTVFMILRYVYMYVPQAKMLDNLILLWSLYLTMTAISLIYKISKIKALMLFITELLFFSFAIFVAMFFFVTAGLNKY